MEENKSNLDYQTTKQINNDIINFLKGKCVLHEKYETKYKQGIQIHFQPIVGENMYNIRNDDVDMDSTIIVIPIGTNPTLKQHNIEYIANHWWFEVEQEYLTKEIPKFLEKYCDKIEAPLLVRSLFALPMCGTPYLSDLYSYHKGREKILHSVEYHDCPPHAESFRCVSFLNSASYYKGKILDEKTCRDYEEEVRQNQRIYKRGN